MNSEIDPGICYCPCTTDQSPLSSSNNAPIKWKLWHSPTTSRGSLGHFATFCARGGENLIESRYFLGGWNKNRKMLALPAGLIKCFVCHRQTDPFFFFRIVKINKWKYPDSLLQEGSTLIYKHTILFYWQQLVWCDVLVFNWHR